MDWWIMTYWLLFMLWEVWARRMNNEANIAWACSWCTDCTALQASQVLFSCRSYKATSSQHKIWTVQLAHKEERQDYALGWTRTLYPRFGHKYLSLGPFLWLQWLRGMVVCEECNKEWEWIRKIWMVNDSSLCKVLLQHLKRKQQQQNSTSSTALSEWQTVYWNAMPDVSNPNVSSSPNSSRHSIWAPFL